jgi:hypothetical protein
MSEKLPTLLELKAERTSLRYWLDNTKGVVGTKRRRSAYNRMNKLNNKIKRMENPPAACCATTEAREKNCESWDCYCSFECDQCHLQYVCNVCGKLHKDK